jgi:ABC-type antimicrobial peptide transport system permease subunit
MQGMLVRTSATDPATLASITVVMVAVCVAACLWPALRATKLDPVIALR